MREKNPWDYPAQWDYLPDFGSDGSAEAAFNVRVNKEVQQEMQRLKSEGKFKGRGGDVVIFDAFGKFKEIVPRDEYHPPNDPALHAKWRKKFNYDHRAMGIPKDWGR